MVKKEIPFVPEYPLRYGWEGLEKLSTELDAEAFDDFDKIVTSMGPKHIRVILWAGLIHKYPGMGVDSREMYDLMDDYMETHSMEELGTLLSKALMESGILGKAEDGAGNVEEGPKKKGQKQSPR